MYIWWTECAGSSDRKFAGKPSGSDGCAAEWIPIGAEHTLYVLDSDNGLQTSVAYTHHKEIGKEMNGTGKMIAK